MRAPEPVRIIVKTEKLGADKHARVKPTIFVQAPFDGPLLSPDVTRHLLSVGIMTDGLTR